MFFGLALSPFGWLLVLCMAVCAFIFPFLVLAQIAAYLPESIQPFAEVFLVGVFMPALMCWLYQKKMFGQGRGAAIFWIYTGIYTIAAFSAVTLVFRTEPSFDLILAAVINSIIAAGMIWWSFKTRKDYANVVAETEEAIYAAEREDQIQRQAEAILRAEKMKEGKA